MPYASVSALFTAICNAVRTKQGTALPIAHQDIPANIDAIVTGGGGADVSGVTALAGDVLAPKIFVDSTGVEVEGTITSKGAATYTPSGSAQEIAAGQYLSGKQTIAAVPTEEKSATPTTSAQDITPTSGKFLSKVAVGAIPSAYKDMTTADIVAANVLNGKKGGNSTGVITGTMPNNAGDKAAVSYHSAGTSIHIVPALGYTDGMDDATVITEAGFTAGNIKSGVSIFGKAGSLSSGTWSTVTGSTNTDSGGVFTVSSLAFLPKLLILAFMDGETAVNTALNKSGSAWYLTSTNNFQLDVTSYVTESAGQISFNLQIANNRSGLSGKRYMTAHPL